MYLLYINNHEHKVVSYEEKKEQQEHNCSYLNSQVSLFEFDKYDRAKSSR